MYNFLFEKSIKRWFIIKGQWLSESPVMNIPVYLIDINSGLGYEWCRILLQIFQ